MRASPIVQTFCVQILLAICVNPASAACLNPPASTQSIIQFKSDPQTLVASSSDTRSIEVLTRDLAGTDASLANDLIRVARGTTPRLQTAIAAGLAQAAIACSSLDQQAALLIQQAVAGFQDGQFQASFAAVAGDLSTAATAAATASAASSVGSVIVTNPATSTAATTKPEYPGAATLGITISAIGAKTPTASAPAASDAGNTAAEPVSATR